MTLDRDQNWRMRLCCGLIWFAMSLALVLEVALLIGWLVGHVGLAFRIGVILHLLGWLWVLRCDRRHRD
ncbi:hypothetical protein [Paracoccus yeei]|uniref:hypothetical protein n=1 Tax=Paracoccus yeei TaxID=147645 RepID=UPI0005698E73|nr:hypothetical protein [Paracoccus yeei]OWJ94519.1 hypothetical protein CDV54_09795 [Paracoccus yeei]